MNRNRPFALAMISMLLAGCGSFTNAVSSPSATGNAPLLNRDELTQLRYVGGNNVWLTANNSGFYELFDFNIATKSASFITPPGISGESGIAYAYNPNLGGVLGYYPFQSLLHSPIVFTKDYGHSWNSIGVDAKMAGIIDPLALSNDRIYIAEGGGTITSGTPTGATFAALPALAHGAVVKGIYGLANGVVAVVAQGTSTTIEYFSESTSTWSSVQKITSSDVIATEVLKGNTVTVGICSQVGSRLKAELFDGTQLTPTFSATSNATLIGCTPELSSATTTLGALTKQGSSVYLVDGSGQKALQNGVTSYVSSGGLNLSIAPYSEGIHLVNTSTNVDYADHINATVANYVNQYQGG